MNRFQLMLMVLTYGITVYSLIHCIRSEPLLIRHLPKIGWMLLILFFPIVGSATWFLAGRPIPTRRTQRQRPIAPDDDPDFLDGLGK